MAAHRSVLATNDKRVVEFVSKLGPEIAEYINADAGCIAPIGSGGRFYGMGLYGFLTQIGKDVSYVEIEKGEGIPSYRLKDVRGRKLIIVDDAISTGKTYRENIEPLKKKERRLSLKGIAVAVEHDMVGLADFAANRNGENKGEKIIEKKVDTSKMFGYLSSYGEKKR